MKKILLTLIAALLVSGGVSAQTANMDQLLEKVKKAVTIEGRVNKDREKEFLRKKNQQASLLAKAKAELRKLEAESDRLKNELDSNEKKLAALETTLQERQGNLGEMAGVVKQVVGDAKSLFANSMISAQIAGRHTFLDELGRNKALPSIDELRQLWFELQREITQQGKVVSFTTDILGADGNLQQNASVIRVGVFTAVANGKFLIMRDGQLVELPRQPASRYLKMAEQLETHTSGSLAMSLDPTSGAILSAVVKTPNLEERIRQGKQVGYVIILLGLLAATYTLYRFVVLFVLGAKIKSQLKTSTPNEGNALGRIMKVYTDNPDLDVETLELKMDEAVMRETPKLTSGLNMIKIAYVVAPLLGLLGTVTGMIETFQMLTLYGTGDPTMMAGGISAALVTTALGLIVAIPLTILHAMLATRSGNLVHILEEQSAGIVATNAEKQDAGAV